MVHLTLEEIVRPYGVDDRTIEFVSGNQVVSRFTYDDFARQIAKAADGLRKLGVRPGHRVAMTIENDPASAVVALGVWRAGATLVSTPPVPRGAAPMYRAGIHPVLDALDCSLLVQPEGDSIRSAFGEDRPIYAATTVLERGDEAAPLGDVSVPDSALIQFTSGSVSSPKGVAVRSDSVSGHVFAMLDHIAVDPHVDRIVSWLPLFHDMGLVGFFLGSVGSRMSSTIATPATFLLNPARWLWLCADRGATLTGAPDFAYRMAAKALIDLPPDALSRLRVAMSGSERVSMATLTEFWTKTRDVGMQWTSLLPVYGMAEATLAVTMPDLGAGPEETAGGHVRLGQPLPGVSVSTAGTPDGPMPVAISGRWMLEGYWTAAGLERPFREDGMFETGDVGFEIDGSLQIVGRRDQVVIAAGRNIYAEDVESVVRSVLGDDLHACAAYISPDSSDRFEIAVEVARRSVVPSDASARIERAVAAALSSRIERIVYLKPWAIPRTTSGKVRRQECRAVAETGAFPRRSVVPAR